MAWKGMETLGNASEAVELAYELELGYLNASTKNNTNYMCEINRKWWREEGQIIPVFLVTIRKLTGKAKESEENHNSLYSQIEHWV